ncbi:stage II sporulation protein M [Aeribacillus pallidus]|jgi:stage II sporulation protein M|uniref:stage II sporulation protein M n=1 Tax=Aeribacillus pallidus TaxID=33936 RepID=UPI001E0911FD|nr:stage II sporulation protein M [Bacillus sp. (in: firmicutes)]
MRKRFRNQPLLEHMNEHAAIYVFVMILFFMGILFGAIVVNSLSFSQKEDLFYYLNEFFGQVSDGKVAASEDLFRLSFLHNAKYLGLMWMLGISIIGLPIILILLFLKGLVVGFSVGFLVHQMGWKGFMLSFATVLPQNLFIIPLFIFMSAVAVGFSLQLIKKIVQRPSYSISFFPLFVKYVFCLIIAFVGITLASSIEAYLSPALMKAVISSLN